MGAAFDAMCENEGLQSRLSKKNKQIREQKKLIAELAEGIAKYCVGDIDLSYEDLVEKRSFHAKAVRILVKQIKKKKS
jgi:hypothetical protein